MAAARVLVVDDDSIVLKTVTRILHPNGYDILPADGPSSALEIVRSVGPVDLVICNIEMPGMLGTQLVREIKRLSPETVAMLITGGSVNPADVPEGVPVVKKPFKMEDLIRAVDKALA